MPMDLPPAPQDTEGRFWTRKRVFFLVWWAYLWFGISILANR